MYNLNHLNYLITKLTPKCYFLFPVVYIYSFHNRNYCYNELKNIYHLLYIA